MIVDKIWGEVGMLLYILEIVYDPFFNTWSFSLFTYFYVFNLHIPDRAYFAIFVFFRHVLMLMINTVSELLHMLIWAVNAKTSLFDNT